MSEWLKMDDPKIILILRGLEISDNVALDDSREVSISKSDFLDDQQWTISDASVQVGIPVKLKMLPISDNEDNQSVRAYFREVDYAKPTFGELLRPGPLGKMIVMRCDGEPLTNMAETCFRMHIEANIGFVKDGITAAKGDTAAMKKIGNFAKERFSPLGLRLHWASVRRSSIANGEEGWLTELNPFFDGWGRGHDQVRFVTGSGQASSDGHPICMACGANKREDDGVLMKCKTCRAIYYCSQQCQKNAWPEHKPYCKKVAE